MLHAAFLMNSHSSSSLSMFACVDIHHGVCGVAVGMVACCITVLFSSLLSSLLVRGACSANLSKAAWGCFEKKNQQLFIRSYEMGVLFLPQSFGAQSFAVASGAGPSDNADKGSACIDASAAAYNDISVHLPYDVPLTPYRAGDQPWTWDSKHLAEDSHGRTWEPR